MLQMRQVDFGNLPTVTKPDELGLPSIQSETIRHIGAAGTSNKGKGFAHTFFEHQPTDEPQTQKRKFRPVQTHGADNIEHEP